MTEAAALDELLICKTLTVNPQYYDEVVKLIICLAINIYL